MKNQPATCLTRQADGRFNKTLQHIQRHQISYIYRKSVTYDWDSTSKTPEQTVHSIPSTTHWAHHFNGIILCPTTLAHRPSRASHRYPPVMFPRLLLLCTLMHDLLSSQPDLYLMVLSRWESERRQRRRRITLPPCGHPKEIRIIEKKHTGKNTVYTVYVNK